MTNKSIAGFIFAAALPALFITGSASAQNTSVPALDLTNAASPPSRANPNPPTEWIDPDTGHRVIRLSREPGSESLYFNLNPFTPDGKKMVITTPTGISTIDLKTRQIEQVVKGRVGILMVGRKTGQVYYYRFDGNPFTSPGRIIYATDLNTKVTREIASLPPNENAVTVNSDETLLAGTITDLSASTNQLSLRSNSNLTAGQRRGLKGERMVQRFNEHLPMELFFLNLKTGEVRKCNRGTNWLNHLQFSPTDPHLLLFCHEGPWQDVDRIWIIRGDGTGLTRIQQRTMVMEIAGHEFWSADGRTIWYDLQTPRGEDFWVGGYNVQSGARTWYHLQRDEWSVHFNASSDGRWFCGDGGDKRMVAHATNGKWIYLFRPEPMPDTSTNLNETGLIHPGVFHAERLVNLTKRDYALEPDAMFSPDMEWVIFRSNVSGASQVYAVEINKAGSE
ncbi:MAG TPA: oligogalacturonate lyase family protein [Candidatus Sulfopaludibacter sp.]|nr:oligogalacturonate lyase family protein [Candidatus Sulfopaludibacter sp.]